MSLLERLERFNPMRVVRTVDAVPRLNELGEKLREDQKEMTRQLRSIARHLEEIDRTLSKQQEALSTLPDLRVQVDRCVTVYTTDAGHAEQMPVLRARLGDGEDIAAHAAAAVARATLELDPFPHVLVENLLPDDVCTDLIAALPPSVFFSQDIKRQELSVPFPFAPERSRTVWGLFFQRVVEDTLIPALTEKFRPALDAFLQKHWPELGTFAESGMTLRVNNSRLLLRRPGYVINPHRDPRWAFLTCLVYLPKPNETQVYGTQLYRLRNEPEISYSSPLWVDPSECELVRDVPARRNTALVFLNSVGAHGASIPPDAPTDIERTVYQVQFGVDEASKQRLISCLSEDVRRSWVMKRDSGYQ